MTRVQRALENLELDVEELMNRDLRLPNSRGVRERTGFSHPGCARALRVDLVETSRAALRRPFFVLVGRGLQSLCLL